MQHPLSSQLRSYPRVMATWQHLTDTHTHTRPQRPQQARLDGYFREAGPHQVFWVRERAQ